MKWFSLLFSVLFTSAYAAPDSVHASYEVTKDFLSGKTVETYTKSGDHYTLTSTTSWGPVPIIISSSNGLITSKGLRPLHFEYRKPRDPDKDSMAEFNWDEMQLTLTRQAQHTQVALVDGTQDRLSAMYQFMFLHLEGKAALDFPMTDGNKLDNYHYAIGQRQKIDTPAGKFDTLYLDSQEKPGERRTEIWLEAKHNIPCQMVITEANGKKTTQILTGLKIIP